MEKGAQIIDGFLVIMQGLTWLAAIIYAAVALSKPLASEVKSEAPREISRIGSVEGGWTEIQYADKTACRTVYKKGEPRQDIWYKLGSGHKRLPEDVISKPDWAENV